MRDEYFLIRGEFHECHPDGGIRMREAKIPPPARIRVIREIRVLLNIEILVFFG